MKAVKSEWQGWQRLFWFTGIVVLLLLITHPALASNTNGGGLPFDDWFTKIRQSVTGPFALTASIVGIVGAGAGLIFGGADMNGFFRTLIFIVLVLSFVVAAQNTISTITGQGAEITHFSSAATENQNELQLVPIFLK